MAEPVATALDPAIPLEGRPGGLASIAIAIVVGSAVFGLLIGAVVLAALAIAFPLAVPIAEQFDNAFSPHDILIARQFAGLWWVFAVLALTTLVTVGVIVSKTVTLLRRRDQPGL